MDKAVASEDEPFVMKPAEVQKDGSRSQPSQDLALLCFGLKTCSHRFATLLIIHHPFETTVMLGGIGASRFASHPL